MNDLGNVLDTLQREVEILRKSAESVEDKIDRTHSLLPTKVDRNEIWDLLF